MTVDYLKNLFLEKYGDYPFLERPVEILVTLTQSEFQELSDDLMKYASPLLFIIEESEFKQPEPGSTLFSRINIPFLCEFIIEIGDQFEFGLLDKTQEYGDETL